jgi:hypothetical protein
MLVSVWKEVVIISLGETEKVHGKHESGYPLTPPRFESDVSRMQIKKLTAALRSLPMCSCTG